MKNTPVCPNCGGDDLSVIGAVLLSPTGVPLGDKRRLLNNRDTVLSREVIKCNSCMVENTLSNAFNAANIPENTYLWEQNEYGVRVPIYCRECGNHENFTQTSIKQIEEDADVYIKDGEIVNSEITTGSAPKVLSSIHIKYVCDACGHVITLYSEDFELVKGH